MAAEHVRQQRHGPALAHGMLHVTSGGVIAIVYFFTLFSVLKAAALELLRIFNSAPAMKQNVVIKAVIMVGRCKMKLN